VLLVSGGETLRRGIGMIAGWPDLPTGQPAHKKRKCLRGTGVNARTVPAAFSLSYDIRVCHTA